MTPAQMAAMLRLVAACLAQDDPQEALYGAADALDYRPDSTKCVGCEFCRSKP